MADGQYTEQITLTAQDAGASAVMQQAISKLAQIDEQLVSLSASGKAAGEAVAAGAATASSGVAAEGAATATTTKLLSDMNMAGGSAARMFNALGIEAAGAAARVEAFTGVLDSMGGLAPEIVAIGAAIIAVGSAFTFFKDGVVDAEALQQSMQRLHAVVDEQGQSWSVASDEIKKFIETESMATGTPETQLADSFAQLAGRIHDVHDAQVIMRVAEEESIATGKGLEEITTALLEAESGRGQTLAMLDPRLKTMIHDHADLHSILTVLHQDNEKALEDSNSAAMSWARGKVALEEMGESIGGMLLPAMQYLGEAFIGAIKVAEDFGHAIGTGISGAAMIFVDSAMAIVHSSEMIGDALKLDFKDAAMQGGLALGSLKSGMDDLKNATIGWLPAFGKGMSDMFHMHQIGHGIVNQAIYEHNHAMSNFTLDNNPTVGYGKTGAKGKKGSALVTMPVEDAFANETRATVGSADEQVKALDPLVRLKNRLATQEEALTRAMKMSTTQSEYDAKQTELKNKLIADALTYEKALNEAVVQGTAAQKRDVETVNSSKDSYDQARMKLNAFNAAHADGTKLSETDKKTQKELQQAVKDTQKAHEDAKKALDHVNTSLSQHITQLDAARKKYHDLKDAADETIPDLQRKWDDFLHKQQQQDAEELATWDMTNAQKAAFYQQMVDSVKIIDQQSLQDREGYEHKYNQAVLGMLKDQENAHKKFVDDAEKMTSTFLDDMLVQHKSFKDSFKTIWDDIVKIFIQDVAKMIVESELFKNIFGNLAPGFGGGASFNPLSLMSLAGAGGGGAFSGSANGIIASVASQGTLADGLIGVPGSVANSALNINVAGTSPSLSTLFGPSTGGLSAGGALMIGGAAFGLGSMIGGMEGAGTGAQSTHSLWGGVGGVAGAAAGGLGALMLGLGGGAFGGLGAGLAMLTPAGWAMLAGGAILGSVLGGQLGPHWAPGTYPDRDPNTQQSWGQDNANLWGAGVGMNAGNLMNANGQQFSMDPTLAQQTGNMGLLQYLGQYIQQNPDQAKQVLGASLVSIFQGEDVATPIPNGKNGILDLANGQQIDWQTLYGDAMQAMQKVQGNGAAGGGAPVFTLNRLYPDYNLAVVKDSSGNPVIVGGGNPRHTGPEPVAPGGGSGPGDGPGHGHFGNPKHAIHIDLRGAQLVGPGGLEDVAQTLATALRMLNNGELPGSYVNTATARSRNGEWQ